MIVLQTRINRLRHLCTLFLLMTLGIACQSGQEAVQSIDADWLIADVTVINVEDGNTTSPAYVAISDGSIAEIYPQKVTLVDTTKVVDGSGKFLIPGLWDMHAHVSINYKYQQGLQIANGVVGVREMWGTMDIIDSIRQQTEAGNMIAPEIYTSGAIIDDDPPYWPGSDIVANAEDAGQVLQKQVDEGVDFFKIYSLLERDAYFAIAEESKRLGVPFGGHVPESISLFEAIDAGQATTEHLMKFLSSCSRAETEMQSLPGLATFNADKINRILSTYDEKLYDSLVQKLANSDTWLVPTMTVKRNVAYLDDTVRFTTDPARNDIIEYMPPHSIQIWDIIPGTLAARFGEDFFLANQKRYKKELSLLGDMQDKGVKMLAGTDYANPYCYPGFSLHTELQILVEGGLSNLEALQTATYNPAVFFGRQSEIGNVTPGMQADLVLLDANPLEDIANTQKIASVFLGGKYLDKASLDKLLTTSKALAKEETNEMEVPDRGFPIHFHDH